ncbi:zinc finger HIT domain-containing protein 2-like [Dorcoceras hygrometricum]|uniref:Zinc finger HIT domain-containing protein 2-like n=1 Tax=Dorcoceras hygrometricum TaxID=472368 RepID=A0A2Z7D7P9_9LAMI|nr:zinc finger HIT domain-containing protein 2-like [Dorcoceras hygrometricum]
MKENVVQELQQLQPDEASKNKMLDILKRFHEEEETSMDSDESDSFLSEETIQKILSGGQLGYNDLSIEEKKHFHRAIASGELSKMIEPWNPWWLKPSAKYIALGSDGTQLIRPILEQDLVASSEETASGDLCYDIPSGPETPIPPLDQLTATEPSPLLTVHAVDIIYSYCFTLRLYNGDWKSDALESATTVLTVSSVLGQLAHPETVYEALLHCLERTCSTAYKHMGGLPFGLILLNDVTSLLYLGGAALVCLLYDLQKMIQAAERQLKLDKVNKLRNAQLRTKFKHVERKIFFIMSWVHEQPPEVWSVLASIVNTEKSCVTEHVDSKICMVKTKGEMGQNGKPLIKEVESSQD